MTDSENMVGPRAEKILAALRADSQAMALIVQDASPYALGAWSRLEAGVQILMEYISGLPEGACTRRSRPGERSPLELWKSFETAAAKMRSDLGISPASYARLMRATGA